MASRRHHLGPDLGAILDGLIAESPGLTAGQIALKFEARTGRTVSRGAIRLRRSTLGKPRAYRLSAADRELLTGLARGAGPRFNRAEIARAFRQSKGRTIAVSTVSRFLLNQLGMPHGQPGRVWAR